jgi:hypothetical protein
VVTHPTLNLPALPCIPYLTLPTLPCPVFLAERCVSKKYVTRVGKTLSLCPSPSLPSSPSRYGHTVCLHLPKT